jgi:DNA-binding transcriptional regulator YdaS (Cro superfamily)
MTDTNSLKALVRARGLKLIDLSRGLGVDKATVTRWAQKRVPAERVVEIERLTGIPRNALRPDLYPAEGAAA